jgi:hypothetical protein
MKGIDAAECVGKIIYNFESSAVQSWILAEEDRLIALTFPEFLITFKKKFLPRTWEDDLVQDQIAIQGSVNFLTWVNKVRNANDELKAAKSPYHIPEDRFRLHLLPRLSDGLKRLYKANNGVAPGATKGTLDAISDFDDWLERLQLLELDLQAARGSGWVAHATKAGNVLRDSSVPNTPNNVSTSTHAYSSSTPLVPLTDAEKDLLKLHHGCFKCRVFYVEHISRNCTNPRPTAEDCKKVTPAHAAKAKVAYERKRQGTTTVAAVFEGGAVFEEDVSNEDSDEFVDANETDEYVPPSLSLPPHLVWTCCIDAPATCAPTPVEALIDHGSPAVLISSTLTEILCLTP